MLSHIHSYTSGPCVDMHASLMHAGPLDRQEYSVSRKEYKNIAI